MNRDLDVLATTQALLQAGIDPESILDKDPNTRRLLEALCIRYNIPAVYKESPP